MKVTRSSICQYIVFHIYILAFYFTFPYKDRWSSTALLLALVFLLCILEYSRTHLFVSPILIWYVFWLGVVSVGRMDLNLYPFYQTWSRPLLKLILWNSIVFFWVYWLAEAWRQRKRIESSYEENSTVIVTAVFAMLVMACAAFLLNVLSTGGVPQFSEDPNTYRDSFVQTKFYKIVNILRFTFALIPFAVKNTRIKWKRISIVILSALLLLFEMMTGWRTYTLQAIILFLTGFFFSVDIHLYKNRKRNFGVLLLAAVIALVFIGYIAVTRDKVSGALKEKFEYLLYTLDMYIAPNFLNIQSAMENVEPIYRPVYSLQAAWTFFLDREAVLGALKEIDQTIGTFNVSTYLLQPWGDYGFLGTIFCSAVLAFLSSVSFCKCREKPGVFSIVLLGLMNITLFVMHNNLFLRAKAVIIWLILAFIIEFVAERWRCGNADRTK